MARTHAMVSIWTTLAKRTFSLAVASRFQMKLEMLPNMGAAVMTARTMGGT